MEQPLLTRQQVRQVDQVAIHTWGIPGVVLMENAGRGVADVMCEYGIEAKVVVVCAKGNNGGDGFVLARHLQLRGFEVEVILCHAASELAGDAASNYDWLCRTGVIVQPWQPALAATFANADWLVDAMLGTGATGAPRAPLDDIIREMNRADANRLAIDLPTGLDCDSGELSVPTFQADHTCTFVAAKPGLLQPTAAHCVGEVHVLDIGIPWHLVEEITEANAP